MHFSRAALWLTAAAGPLVAVRGQFASDWANGQVDVYNYSDTVCRC